MGAVGSAGFLPSPRWSGQGGGGTGFSSITCPHRPANLLIDDGRLQPHNGRLIPSATRTVHGPFPDLGSSNLFTK